ncbi:MAG: bacteriohemerythrin [Brevinematia bacterium]
MPKEIEFTEDMLIGVELIDDEHKELIKRVNEFIKKLSQEQGVSKEDINNVFNFMEEYAQTHFRDEENLMNEHNCPILNFQKVQHNFFLIEAKKLKFDLDQKGLTEEVISKAQSLLVDWIVAHIKGIDKKIKGCVHKNL